MNRALLSILFVSVLCGNTRTFDPNDYRERDITAIRLDESLRIDGLLTESFYNHPSYGTFIQLNPDNGEPATEKTEVWIGYDDAALYVGARLWDSQPDSIVGRMGRRDSESNSDAFHVAIDSYHDKRSGFFFVVNPSGAISDGTVSNDSRFDNTWDGVWDTKTSINDKGWTAEMRIPFSQLRFNRQEEHVWGIGFGRMIQRKNEFALITYIPRGESGIVSHFATLKGIAHIDPPKRREFLPYLTSGYGFLPSKKDNPFFNGRDSNFDLGTDIKLGIGSNLTIDATINPDFGQVEVDPSVINLSAYETFYQEKRPFFVEGAHIFSFGRGGPTSRWGFNFSEPNFFYSRRMGRPPQGSVSAGEWVDKPTETAILGAAKISGKLNGDWAIGGTTALTGREYARIKNGGERNEQEVEPLTSHNLIRTQKEFNDGLQGLGLIGTYVYRHFEDQSLRDVLSDNALAFGVDGWMFLNDEKDWVISGWGGFTRITASETRMLRLQRSSSHFFQRPDVEHVSLDSTLTQMTGYAGRFIINKEKGHLLVNGALGIISPGFDSNDLGLTFGTDRINQHMVLGYRWYDPGKVFRYATLNTAYMTNHNFGGKTTNQNIFVFGNAQFLNYWGINGFVGGEPRTLSDTQLRGGPMVISPRGFFHNIGVRSDNRKNTVYSLNINGGQSEKGGRRWGISSRIEIKLGTQLRVNLGPNFSGRRTIDQYVTEVSDESATHTYGTRYIMAQIDQKTLSADIRIDYTFTPTLSLQAYFQPFIAVGQYSKFKEFKRPRSYDFLIYGEEGTSIEKEDQEYRLDPTGGDDEDSFTVYNPNFNYKALVGNAVLRWEFRPGSTLYLVWTRNGSDNGNSDDFRLRRDLTDLFRAKTDNVFAIKVAYWLGQ